MSARAKRAVGAAASRVLAASGYEGADLVIAHGDTLEWARTRFRALRRRRGVVGGQAVVISVPGRAELRPVDRVRAGEGEVTVEVLVSAVSPGTERAQWLRLPNARPRMPYTPGYSGAGRVLLAGPGASFEPGEIVAVARLPHTSVATVPAAWLAPVPDGVPLPEAALVYLSIIAGYGVRRAGLQPGEPLCVIGAGPIGALAQRLALLEDPGPVTVVAASDRRRESALRAGAQDFRSIDDGVADIEAASVIEATGDPQALAAAIEAARPGATVVLLGSARGVTKNLPVAEIKRKRLRLVGAHINGLAVEARGLSSDPFRSLADRYLDARASGRLDAGDLVGPSVDPREVALMYRRLAAGIISAASLDWTRIPAGERVRRRAVIAPPELPSRRPRARIDEDAGAPASAARLRFSVIGCGDIGIHNARAVAAAGNAELVFCHDAVPSLSQATAEELGCRVAGDLAQALDPKAVDAVFISVPHDLHEPLAVEAARSGLHVVVEKPLAADLRGARTAVEAAEQAGVALSVCFPFRYEPAVVAARRLVGAGALGELRGATVVFHADKPASYWASGFSGRATSDWRGRRDRSGGGVLIMNLTHYIDFIRHVAGADAKVVTAVSRTAPGSEIEDSIVATVEFEGGAIGSLSGSASTRGNPPNRFEIWGEHGSIRLEPEPWIFTERAVDGVVTGRWCALPVEPARDPREVFVTQFAQAVLDGRPPDVTAADGVAVQAFVEAAYRSVDRRAPVTLEELVGAIA